MPHRSHTTRFRPRVESFEERALPAAWTPIPDGTLVVAPDDGGAPKVHLIDPVTGREVRQVIGYEGSFRGGIHAELGDVTGDGTDDLVFAPGGGGGPPGALRSAGWVSAAPGDDILLGSAGRLRFGQR